MADADLQPSELAAGGAPADPEATPPENGIQEN